LPVLEVRARLKKFQDGNGPEAVALLEQYAQGKDANLGTVAVTLEGLAEPQAAERMYRKYFAESKLSQSRLTLARFLGRQKKYQEAIRLCEGAWETCPPEAVAEALLLVLYVAPEKDTVQPLQDLDQLLGGLVKKQPQNLGLRLSLAALRNFQGRPEEAEKIYRDLLVTQPRNPVVLNNLAWLIAQIKKDDQTDLKEALQFINEALEVAGPLPSLLDTRAVVYLRLKQAAQALDDLEEVIALKGTALRYFHLAQAYALDKNLNEMRKALKRAKELKDRGEAIDPDERRDFDAFVAEHPTEADRGQ
jgi:tetratricopeptide (TPR) repeat protein